MVSGQNNILIYVTHSTQGVVQGVVQGMVQGMCIHGYAVLAVAGLMRYAPCTDLPLASDLAWSRLSRISTYLGLRCTVFCMLLSGIARISYTGIAA